MKLEVGQFVRTNKGIFQIRNKDVFIEDKKQYIGVNGRYTCIDIETIEKASHNIIDLIEVGDFITLGENNYPLQIRNIWENGGDIHIELSNGAKFEDLHYNNEFKIYSIVTKEQMEAMQYKVV